MTTYIRIKDRQFFDDACWKKDYIFEGKLVDGAVYDESTGFVHDSESVQVFTNEHVLDEFIHRLNEIYDILGVDKDFGQDVLVNRLHDLIKTEQLMKKEI